jgi:hypothetical protein
MNEPPIEPSPGETAMITAIVPLTLAFPQVEPPVIQTSAAVARCQQAWDRAYHFTMKLKRGGANSRLDAADAFRLAMPQLVSYDNICEFIACVGYAMVNDILMEETGTRFLNAAKLALDVLMLQPNIEQRDSRKQRNAILG